MSANLSTASVFGGPGAPAPVAVDVGAINTPVINATTINADSIGASSSITCVGDITGINIPDCVSTVNSAANGDVLTYDSGLSLWKPAVGGGGLTPSYGYFVYYEPGGPTAINLGDIYHLDTVVLKSADLTLAADTITINTTGIYQIDYESYTIVTAGPTSPKIALALNATILVPPFGNTEFAGSEFNNGFFTEASGYTTLSITAGDTLQLICQQNGTSYQNAGTSVCVVCRINRIA